MSGGYSLAGGPELDRVIDAHLAGIRDHLLSLLPPTELDCLALGGGYGRGDGGVVATADGPRPYNDYDLVLIHHVRDRARLDAALAAVQRDEGARCGIHVDITPIARARVPRLPPALTWFEFGVGHRVVWGDATAVAPLATRTLADVHPSEWGRLLTNRAAGLVFARRALAGEACAVRGNEDPRPFIERQLQKAWLAYGDVQLADRGLYHPRVAERLRAAEGLVEPWIARWREAAGFKRSPRAPRALADLGADLATLTPSMTRGLLARDAAPARRLYGLLCTARHLPPSRWLASAPWRYPRERVRLACAAELAGDAAARDRLCGSAAGLVALWSRFG
ncbi:MAG TPA: hypothetical protein VEL07_14730 [Planctomycetota bacterium]|nr:hypothetical protein [Planctomycetota bacterium]